MRKIALWLAAVVALFAAGIVGYGLHGYFSAMSDGAMLAARADRLIAQGRGPADLGPGRIQQLLAVEDPGFSTHRGVDLSTPGSGLTTLTQSLGKRVGFRPFRPGLRKIRLIGYAKGLERKLRKEQILALYLDTVEMGRGPSGWMTGFFDASQLAYRRPPAALSQREFLTLVAIPIAPGKLDLRAPDSELRERVDRIERLVAKRCKPTGLRDVWLVGCAKAQVVS